MSHDAAFRRLSVVSGLSAPPVNRITFYAHPALLLHNGRAEVRVRTSISDSNENPHRATSAMCVKTYFCTNVVEIAIICNKISNNAVKITDFASFIHK